MLGRTKMFFFNFLIHLIILSVIFIGIQNSNKKNIVKLSTLESVEMPVGFIVVLSFILGSFTGGAFSILSNGNQKH